MGRLAPIAVALAAAGAAIRLLHVPAVVHQEDPLGLLRSDPALLYYITARVVEHGGRLPDDFRADPRIEWPEPTDIPATFTVGQELLVAWAYLGYAGLGGELPLHRFAHVDKTFLWDIRYEAGLPSRAPTPPPAGAAFRLLHNDPEVYGSVPGYRLLYRSLNPISRYRIYELIDAE